MEGLIFDMDLLWMHSPIRDPHQTASSITSCAVHTHAEHCTGCGGIHLQKGLILYITVNLTQLLTPDALSILDWFANNQQTSVSHHEHFALCCC